MQTRPDISVYSSDNRLQLVVEVKHKLQPSATWAAQLRRNLLAHAVLPTAPFFMLALPEQLFFWKNTEVLDDRLPDHQLSTAHVLRNYFGDQPARPSLGEQGLELIIADWLNDLASDREEARQLQSASRWFVDSGFLNSIRRGTVRIEQAA